MALGGILERSWRLLECSWSALGAANRAWPPQDELSESSRGDQAEARGGVGEGISSLSPWVKEYQG